MVHVDPNSKDRILAGSKGNLPSLASAGKLRAIGGGTDVVMPQDRC